jgi:hypothetical protein
VPEIHADFAIIGHLHGAKRMNGLSGVVAKSSGYGSSDDFFLDRGVNK